jgi:heme-degrading monooxygenase HmoA
MSFIQLIDYETDRADEIDAAMRESMAQGADAPGFTRLEHTQDHDNPRHYVTVVEFDTYEAAMANSNKPETDAMASQLAAMCTRGPSYQNLDVKLTMP